MKSRRLLPHQLRLPTLIPSWRQKQVDASKKGLGAALIQIEPKHPEQENIIAFASKSLTETEKRYT
jgi:hypothetical protein